MEQYAQNLHISDNAFEGMRKDADLVLQRLIKNMIEKDSMEGKVTITIDVSLIQDFILNRDPRIEGETRRVLTPKLSHKVGSVMQIKNEEKGGKFYDGMELTWDEELKEYVLKPIANTDQMTIFDADFRCVNDEEYDDDIETQALEGRRVAALPGPSEEADEECEEEENNEEAFGDTDVENSDEDLTEHFFPDAEEVFNDEYAYEEPEEY